MKLLALAAAAFGLTCGSASAQAISWSVVSTTEGLVLAPTFPNAPNLEFFDRQRAGDSIFRVAAVHPFSQFRSTARISGSAEGLLSSNAAARSKKVGTQEPSIEPHVRSSEPQ